MTTESPISSLPFDPAVIHSASSAEQEEYATALALGALTPGEKVQLLEHTRACLVCQRLVSEFQMLANLLPQALEEQTASSALKERILAQAKTELAGEVQHPAVTSPGQSQTLRGRRWSFSMASKPMAAMAVLVLAVLGMVAWNIVLQLQSDDRGDLTVQQRHLLDAIAAGARVYPLSGTESAPGASGRLVQPLAGQEAFLLLKDLPELPNGKVYQAWRITAGVPMSVGVLASVDAGDHLVVLPVAFSAGDGIGVSIEPEGGSPAPTGAIVLLGRL